MTVPREQEVLALMSGVSGIEPVADLLVSLGFEDVAKELRLRWDDSCRDEDGEEWV